MIGQEEGNPVFWLANNQAAMRWAHVAPPELSRKDKFAFWPYKKSFIGQAWSVKMDFGKVRFCAFMDRDIFEVNKNSGG